MKRKIISSLFFITVIVVGFTQKETLLNVINEGGYYSIAVSMMLVAICVFFPIVPFPILAGTIGAIFGIIQGVIISLSGAMLGTLLLFFISRYGFKDWAQQKLESYPKVKEYEEILNKNSFVAILLCRLVPIVPSPVLNIICGLSKVKWLVFFIASAIGKLPNILILSFAGAKFTENKLFSFGLYGIYVLVLIIINYLVIAKRKTNSEVNYK